MTRDGRTAPRPTTYVLVVGAAWTTLGLWTWSDGRTAVGAAFLLLGVAFFLTLASERFRAWADAPVWGSRRR